MCMFAEELVSAYPEAKVVLSVRDSAQVWKRSMERTTVPTARSFCDLSLPARIVSFFAPKRAYHSGLQGGTDTLGSFGCTQEWN